MKILYRLCGHVAFFCLIIGTAGVCGAVEYRLSMRWPVGVLAFGCACMWLYLEKGGFMESKDRWFWWDDVSPECSILYGPNPQYVGWPEPAVVIRREKTEWTVTGREVGCLFIPLEKSLDEIKRRMLRLLIEDRKLKEKYAELDRASLMQMFFAGGEEDPYSW